MKHVDYGYANSTFNIKIPGYANRASKNRGSIHGGLLIVMKGYGFITTGTSCLFHWTKGTITSINNTHVYCITPPLPAAHYHMYVYNSRKRMRITTTVFTSTLSYTPDITSVSPTNGLGGDTITLVGKFYVSDLSVATVKIRDDPCTVTSFNKTTIQCVLPDREAGVHEGLVHIKGYGNSNKFSFTYNLRVTDVVPLLSGYGGERLITIQGTGFSSQTNVTICDSLCRVTSSNATELKCVSPPYSRYDTSLTDTKCRVKVTHQTGESDEFSGTDIFLYHFIFTVYK